MDITIKFTDQLSSLNDHVRVIVSENVIINDEQKRIIHGDHGMTAEQFINQMIKSIEKENRKVETPILPVGTVKYSVLQDESDKNKHEVFIEIPKKQWEITFYNETFKVGFPRMIFKYEVVEKKKGTYQVKKIFIVSLKGTKKINGEAELFRFPFSHIHPETMEVCMGMNRFPNMNCLSQLETYHNLFFSSPFGNDYYNDGVNTVQNTPLRNLLEGLKNKDFNEDYLSSMKKTFNEFFDFDVPKEKEPENNVVNI